MSKIDYQSLREAVQNYQSTLAWYQEKPDSPNAERDCDAALAAFKREIHHREVDMIAGLLDELDEKQQYIKLRDQENEDIALTVGKLRVELEETKSKLNEQREYYEGVISDGGKRIAELEKSEEQLINERDHAESALDDMYFAATGNRPEWSNWFGFSDAVDAVVDRIADLEAKQCIEEMSKQSCEARERDLFESWVMHSICISKSTLEGLRTETGYRNATLSGTDFNRMWEQWKSIRAAGIRIKGE
ncbi:ead/Ea22-like family protein [Escherichia coli]|nr:ead/Ea22-like family protein [Escherichia coli]EGY0375818.1 ead/Ea22-like family protein [Escherichia coli]EIW7368855.1 ead/Ea22-like family protein [Escherichia coli]EJF8319919.1 ead/Ea22-like family protein [Escherichia coli]EJK2340424.1 ead/Ea22-like family protein [Escherichia coli]